MTGTSWSLFGRAIVADRSATLLAGCGIVADSDPDREWLEAEAKLLALGSALGRMET